MAKVMVVEDEPALLSNLCQFLRSQGHEVVGAPRGDEAIRLLPEAHPELVITDLEMTPVDGLQVLRAAKELDPSTAVIVTTAYPTVRNAVIAMKRGADDYLNKPFYFSVLKGRIGEALQGRADVAMQA
jgi:DNA-binding response OmpR family regulator